MRRPRIGASLMAGFALALAISPAIALAPAVPATAAEPAVELEYALGPGGRFLPVIEVSINGSAPLRMLADTGSDILVTFPGSLDGVIIDDTGVEHTANYTGTSTTGTIARAIVSLGTTTGGTVLSASEVWFLNGSTCTPDCLGDGIGADLDGIFGLSQGQTLVTNPSGSPPSFPLFSPAAQLFGAAGEGYTVRLGEAAGELSLGRPLVTAADTVLQQLSTGTGYPTGRPGFVKRVPMCFQVGGTAACFGTTIDSGEFTASLMGPEFAASPDIAFLTNPVFVPGVAITKLGAVKSGLAIGYATSREGLPFAQWITGSSPHQMEYYTSTGERFLNTGNGFFIGRSIGFDNTDGRVVIGPSALAPSAPSSVSAMAGVGSVDVSWADATGATPVVGYVVTVSRSGTIIGQRSVDASARRATVEGLTAGPVAVSVVAASRFAAGAVGSVESSVLALPATGNEREIGADAGRLALLATAIALFAFGLVLRRHHRREKAEPKA